MKSAKRLGIIGYGALGKYLLQQSLVTNATWTVEFVCNRSTVSDASELHCSCVCLENFSVSDMTDLIKSTKVDLVIEVAHPHITEIYGECVLSRCDYMVGSPTVFSDEKLLRKMIDTANQHNTRLFIPVGALWGAEDIMRMADRDTLKNLCISMTKHPSCFRLEDDELVRKNKYALDQKQAVVLYEGPVSGLCRKAPNNVNTMAVAAIAGHNLGFNNCVGKLISDPNLIDFHKIEIDVTGPTNSQNNCNFSVKSTRMNPAPIGGVTGIQTYVSFYSSLKYALRYTGPVGLRIC